MITQYILMIQRFDSRTKLCQFVVENDRSQSVEDFKTGKVSSLKVAIERSESIEKYW